MRFINNITWHFHFQADAIISKLSDRDYKDHEEPTLLITADQVCVHIVYLYLFRLILTS